MHLSPARMTRYVLKNIACLLEEGTMDAATAQAQLGNAAKSFLTAEVKAVAAAL
jgi:hypothetical protein